MTQEAAIAEITARLVQFFHPARIYLFGSVARGEAGPDSDLDFCVVVRDDTPVDKLRAGAARRVLRDIRFPKDIIPWAESDFEIRSKWVKTSLPATILREGRLLYESH